MYKNKTIHFSNIFESFKNKDYSNYQIGDLEIEKDTDGDFYLYEVSDFKNKRSFIDTCPKTKEEYHFVKVCELIEVKFNKINSEIYKKNIKFGENIYVEI